MPLLAQLNGKDFGRHFLGCAALLRRGDIEDSAKRDRYGTHRQPRGSSHGYSATSGLQERQLLEPTGNSFVHTVSLVSLVRTAMTEAPLTL